MDPNPYAALAMQQASARRQQALQAILAARMQTPQIFGDAAARVAQFQESVREARLRREAQRRQIAADRQAQLIAQVAAMMEGAANRSSEQAERAADRELRRELAGREGSQAWQRLSAELAARRELSSADRIAAEELARMQETGANQRSERAAAAQERLFTLGQDAESARDARAAAERAILYGLGAMERRGERAERAAESTADRALRERQVAAEELRTEAAVRESGVTSLSDTGEMVAEIAQGMLTQLAALDNQIDAEPRNRALIAQRESLRRRMAAFQEVQRALLPKSESDQIFGAMEGLLDRPSTESPPAASGGLMSWLSGAQSAPPARPAPRVIPRPFGFLPPVLQETVVPEVDPFALRRAIEDAFGPRPVMPAYEAAGY